ncbi:UNVERIFIED_CONTAM: hypothetical protein PYX00_007247 [Menopon gallinae]|uniref:Centrosomal protein CCDC61 n=1 Tax=Menopon gallinae TaxID=328185 RepID=A0AAW2HIC4_9NEOP
MNEPFQLVTNCTFKGKDYLVQMCVLSSKKLELTVTDKLMAEDWQCEYDASYIEALTHKTGNFKNFDVFVMMLKSGLLRTSDSITLDLLTIEDLEELRNKKIINSHPGSRFIQAGNLNKRYLILTYTVEFDRIHYPLPLDYCGPPDPAVLQGNIRRLEAEVQKLRQRNNGNLSRSDAAETRKLKEKIDHLLEDNSFLSSEIRRLNKILSKTAKPAKTNQILQNTLKRLEEQVMQERNNFHHTIWKLRDENRLLKLQIEEYKTTERHLKLRLRNASKYSVQKGQRRAAPGSRSPEQCSDKRRTVGGERSESQLTCRAISSWNSTALAKPVEKRLENKIRSRSSSESGVDKSEKLGLRDAKMSKQRLSTKQASRKSSVDRSRNSSCEKRTNVQTEAIRPIPGKSRPCRVRRDSSVGSDTRTGRQSRESSVSSRTSSRHSRDSHFSRRGSGDKFYKHRSSSKTYYTDHDELKFSVSDLESRIHALQKILSEGLNF